MFSLNILVIEMSFLVPSANPLSPTAISGSVLPLILLVITLRIIFVR